MNIKYIVIIVLLLVLGFYVFKLNSQDTVLKDTNPSLDQVSNIAQKKHETKSSLERAIENLKVHDSDREFARRLLPIASVELKDFWEEEYGCYSYGKNQSVEFFVSSECEHSILTANSFEEAEWMQKQGYPSRSVLALLKDKANMPAIKKLANENFVPAINLMAMASFENGDYQDAASWALTSNAYSNKQSTFAYRIRGEAQISNGIQELGLMELKVASYLGDEEAEYLFNRYAYANPRVGIMAVEHANLYMSRTFGVPFDQYPSNPRPNSSNGG